MNAPVRPYPPNEWEYKKKTERRYIYSFRENLQEDDWDDGEDDTPKAVPEKPIEEANLGWLLSLLPGNIKPEQVKLEFGFHASSMAYEDHWIRFYYEVEVPARKADYKAAVEQYKKDLAQYEKDLAAFEKARREKEIQETEEKLARLKNGS